MAIIPMILIRAGGLPFQPNEFKDILYAGYEALASDAAAQVQTQFDSLLAKLPASTFRTAVFNARKAFFQKRKMPGKAFLSALEFYQDDAVASVLLTKLQIWEDAARWGSRFEEAYLQRLEQEWASIQLSAADPLFQRALLFASHDLLARLPEFCEKAVSEFSKNDRQTALSVFQYLCRSTFKTSPLSRFGTVQLWRLGQERELGFEIEKIAVTPNVAMLPALYSVLLRNPNFYESLDVELNPSHSAEGSTTAAMSWLYFDGEREAFQRLEQNLVADLVVQVLLENNRKLPYQRLLANLLEAVDAPKKDLEKLLRDLIDLGLVAWVLPETGMTPSWCSNLSLYLSHLPSDPLLMDTAFLLQMLKVTSKAIPYQTIKVAKETQHEARVQVMAYFEKHGGTAPPIPAEQIFFEDVARELPNSIPEAAVRQFAEDLSSCWKNREEDSLSGLRARLHCFAKEKLRFGEVLDFQQFCTLFFAAGTSEAPIAKKRFSGTLGALLQVFTTPEGPKAVVNAMFPGGGKLCARWMHLFPTSFKDAFPQPEFLFPWQGWSNANFQPLRASRQLAVPDGRIGDGIKKGPLLLSNLGVSLDENGPVLVEKMTRQTVELTDLGLESPESRPPVMQVLWHLGVPYVSSNSLLGTKAQWQTLPDGTLKRPRVEYNSLVLARAAWRAKRSFFDQAMDAPRKSAMRHRQLTTLLSNIGLPRYFFARPLKNREKPQYFDMGSPVSMLIFEKMLEMALDQEVHLEEMLPTPDEWVIGDGKYAAELVVEIV